MRISDWSSDVCSSDLAYEAMRHVHDAPDYGETVNRIARRALFLSEDDVCYVLRMERPGRVDDAEVADGKANGRSEERRVGKECVRKGRFGWSPEHENKKYTEDSNKNTKYIEKN